VGKLWDLVIDLDQSEPEVKELAFRKPWSMQKQLVPWDSIDERRDGSFHLRGDVYLRSLDAQGPSEILVREFLLDKQIVDVNGAKVERVNDLQFFRSNGRLILAHVDVGLRGLLRRLGWEVSVVRFGEWFFDYTMKERFISWHYAQPLADPDRLRLQIAESMLPSLHPADLADIIEDMDVHERAAIVESLNLEVLADAMEELQPHVQVSIMRGLEAEKAADIIEEMSPDEAADLMADLPSDTVDGIFHEMDDSYEQEVRKLLAHDEDEAGGLMSTEFLALRPDKTVVEALSYIKQNAERVDAIYYTYVVDTDNRLLGVTNLRQLLSAEIFTPLEQLMTARTITAGIDADAKDLANLFAKYGFRAIPVVDDNNRLLGVIRFKALLEILAPYLGT
jgi:CBS domain-containing protein